MWVDNVHCNSQFLNKIYQITPMCTKYLCPVGQISETVHKVRQPFFHDFWRPPLPCQQLSAFQHPLPKKSVSICKIVPRFPSFKSAMCISLNVFKKAANISSHKKGPPQKHSSRFVYGLNFWKILTSRKENRIFKNQTADVIFLRRPSPTCLQTWKTLPLP